MLNDFTCFGNLTNKPEIKDAGESKVAKFRIAINRYAKPEPKTTFIQVEVWGARGESCAKYLDKGSPVLVKGALAMNEYENKDGVKQTRYFIDAEQVEFLSRYGSAKTGEVNYSQPATGCGSSDSSGSPSSCPSSIR